MSICFETLPFNHVVDMTIIISSIMHVLKTRSMVYMCVTYISDMNGQTFFTIHHLNHPRSNGIC